MCALFGWLDYKGIVSDRLLKKLTQALANAAEERGTDASGIAYVKSGKVTIYKRPKPAHKLRFNAPNGTRAVMGHTRMTTQGNEKFNYNNHPFRAVSALPLWTKTTRSTSSRAAIPCACSTLQNWGFMFMPQPKAF